MPRFMKLLIASALATLFTLTAAPALALNSAAEWLEALRPIPLRDTGPPAKVLPVAVLAFAPNSARLEERSMGVLDQLAAALTSPELAQKAVQVGWYVEPNARPPLSNQRAATVEAYLEAKPGVGPRRLDMRRLAEIPPGVTEATTGDKMAIRVLNLGLAED